MTEVLHSGSASWWSSTSWFAGGLQDPASAAPAPAPSAEAPPAASEPPTDGLVSVGGAKAQSRFSGKTAIPIGTVAPLSSASLDPKQPEQAVQPEQAQAQQQPALRQAQQQAVAAAPSAEPAAGRHAPWGGRTAVGRTVDGSLPSPATDSLRGEHVSRWVFDTRNWRWALKGEHGAGLPAGPSDKHQLAARRWGDGRDALGAAALQTSSVPAAAAPAAAAAAAGGPSKRPQLQVSALTGDASDAGFAAVGGLQIQKELLLQQVVYPLLHPRLFSRLGVSCCRGVLLHGAPGSGKTHLVRALAAEARLPIVWLNGGECVGEHAERNLRRAFASAKSQQPCILLLDELDALAPCRAQSHSEHERQATARLLAAMDELRASRCRVGLVGATNRRAGVDGALHRAGRLDTEVALGALGEEERFAVLRCCTQRMPLAPCVDLPAVAARLRGYVAADVAAVASEAGLLCAAAAVEAADARGRLAEVESEEFLEGLRVTAEQFEAAVARLGPAVLRGLAPEVPEITWDDVGGLEDAKAALRELVELPLRHGGLLSAYGLPPPRGALLYGPPGCGKTLLAKAAAAQCGANFLSIRGPELLQKWLGESERAVREVFDTARQAAPCLIFFDEIDSIACRRGAGGSASAGGDAAAARVLNQLLVEMDGLSDRGGVFVLCATNRPEALDPALTRPGRLDHLLRVPLPDEPARLAVLQAALRRCPLGADVALAELAGAPTAGLSGADLAEVCRRAGMAAIRELVAAEEAWLAAREAAQREGGSGAALAAPPEPAPLQQQHLLAALATVQRSVSDEESQRYARIERHLADGSLPAPEPRSAGRQQAAAVLQRAVQAAVAGSVERQLSALQQRVQQLEALARGAGLEVPPPISAAVVPGPSS
ncbi:hypothetical protein ABPG75_012938 [Micractinium tetrahymenae]